MDEREINKLKMIEHVINHSNTLNKMLFSNFMEEFYDVCDVTLDRIRHGGKLIICGNGGSAADSQHIAAELVCSYKNRNRPAIPAVALTTDSSVITAWSNDREYENVFARQFKALAKPEDVFLGITTSGISDNVLNTTYIALYMDVPVVMFTSTKCPDFTGMKLVKVPSEDTPIIQEMHIMLGHIMCDYLERKLF